MSPKIFDETDANKMSEPAVALVGYAKADTSANQQPEVLKRTTDVFRNNDHPNAEIVEPKSVAKIIENIDDNGGADRKMELDRETKMTTMKPTVPPPPPPRTSSLPRGVVTLGCRAKDNQIFQELSGEDYEVNRDMVQRLLDTNIRERVALLKLKHWMAGKHGLKMERGPVKDKDLKSDLKSAFATPKTDEYKKEEENGDGLMTQLNTSNLCNISKEKAEEKGVATVIGGKKGEIKSSLQSKLSNTSTGKSSKPQNVKMENGIETKINPPTLKPKPETASATTTSASAIRKRKAPSPPTLSTRGTNGGKVAFGYKTTDFRKKEMQIQDKLRALIDKLETETARVSVTPVVVTQKTDPSHIQSKNSSSTPAKRKMTVNGNTSTNYYLASTLPTGIATRMTNGTGGTLANGAGPVPYITSRKSTSDTALTTYATGGHLAFMEQFFYDTYLASSTTVKKPRIANATGPSAFKRSSNPNPTGVNRRKSRPQIRAPSHDFNYDNIRLCEKCVRNEAYYVCGACEIKWYCSRNCQSIDWDFHYRYCPGIDINK